MKPLGAKGSRKVHDILTDLHVPTRRKARTLVVTMDGKPVWVVGARIADEVKLTERTRRVIHLRFVKDLA